MGFCSGTDIFDPVIKTIIETPGESMSRSAKLNIIEALIEALEDHDWDCQSDSAYYDNPLVQEIIRESHPDWFEDEEDDYPPREN